MKPTDEQAESIGMVARDAYCNYRKTPRPSDAYIASGREAFRVSCEIALADPEIHEPYGGNEMVKRFLEHRRKSLLAEPDTRIELIASKLMLSRFIVQRNVAEGLSQEIVAALDGERNKQEARGKV